MLYNQFIIVRYYWNMSLENDIFENDVFKCNVKCEKKLCGWQDLEKGCRIWTGYLDNHKVTVCFLLKNGKTCTK